MRAKSADFAHGSSGRNNGHSEIVRGSVELLCFIGIAWTVLFRLVLFFAGAFWRMVVVWVRNQEVLTVYPIMSAYERTLAIKLGSIISVNGDAWADGTLEAS